MNKTLFKRVASTNAFEITGGPGGLQSEGTYDGPGTRTSAGDRGSGGLMREPSDISFKLLAQQTQKNLAITTEAPNKWKDLPDAQSQKLFGNMMSKTATTASSGSLRCMATMGIRSSAYEVKSYPVKVVKTVPQHPYSDQNKKKN